jgi:hypothetical protein
MGRRQLGTGGIGARLIPQHASPGSAFDEAAIIGEVLALARSGIQLIGLNHSGPAKP